MCQWGTTRKVKVKIPANLSSTGKVKWKRAGIDSCIAKFVAALQRAGIDMDGSCCGHGKSEGYISLRGGRSFLVLNREQTRMYNRRTRGDNINSWLRTLGSNKQ